MLPDRGWTRQDAHLGVPASPPQPTGEPAICHRATSLCATLDAESADGRWPFYVLSTTADFAEGQAV